MNQAFEGLKELAANVDSIIVVSNDRLLEVIGGRPLKESFREADNVLRPRCSDDYRFDCSSCIHQP